MASASTSYFKWFYFSMQGRTGRRAYWLFLILPLFLVGFMLGLFIRTFHISLLFGAALLLALVLLLFWISVAVSVKRLHDFGRSGWWVIACFIPYVHLVAFLVLGLIPGQADSNEYGANRNKG
jgi:uncharacterized membrane protein YhaH (DUF805 family)